jgi:pimeloyl-ACP methyl ester carboxylesterase
MTVSALQPKCINANGIEIAYLERGSGPLVICLHGFPDMAWSFVPVLDQLAAAGFRAVAPFLRGYAPTSLAADNDYRWTTLAQDLLGLIDAIGKGEKVYVVGHDWGSVVAQLASKLRPQQFERLVLCAVPHLRHFFLSTTLRQIARSHYMVRFQFPRWAEAALPRDDFAWMEQVLIRRWSPGWRYSEAGIAPLKANFSDPLRLKAALAYYRNIPGFVLNGEQRRLGFAPIGIPTRMIYGSDDGCIGAEMFSGQEALFTKGLDLCEAKGMGHFMQAENPDWFAARLVEFFRS